MSYRHFKHGILVEEILDGESVTTNLGKTTAQLMTRVDGGLKLSQPIPRKDWPLWAKGLAMMSKPEDKGVGDVVARTVGSENSEAFKKWYKATTGKDCGCNGRQKLWNQKYPLNLKAT